MRIENLGLTKHKITCTSPISNPLQAPVFLSVDIESGWEKGRGVSGSLALVGVQNLRCNVFLSSPLRFFHNKPTRYVLEVEKGDCRGITHKDWNVSEKEKLASLLLPGRISA